MASKYDLIMDIQSRAQRIISALTVTKSQMPGVIGSPGSVQVSIGMNQLGTFEDAAEADALVDDLVSRLKPTVDAMRAKAEADMAAVFAS